MVRVCGAIVPYHKSLGTCIALGQDGTLPSVEDQILAQRHIENVIQRDVQAPVNIFVGLQIRTKETGEPERIMLRLILDNAPVSTILVF